jgi:lipid A 3-O-deacylase|tara:strand:+ start:394 stop:891 length:498 start_codon:yes stop_codon:yes gene_type:complete
MRIFLALLLSLLLFTNLFADESNTDLTFYTGKFDTKDEVGDDETTLFGLEHRNPNLFRNTILGKFAPVSGMFLTGKGAAYFYTGVEAQYEIGALQVIPSFTPGYYEKGGGKKLGDVLEFKSELKLGLDIFDNSKVGFSYSHISNNDWGSVNPGADNQSLTFSKKF